MHTWLIKKYLGLISFRLQNYSIKNNTSTFRCPFCGDSKKNQYKTRGYIYETKKGYFNYKCHNCGIQYSFDDFLQQIDPQLYDEYKLEIFKEKFNKKIDEISEEEFKQTLVDESFDSRLFKTIAELKDTHPAKKYVIHRKIPEKYHSVLQYCSDFSFIMKKQFPENCSNFPKEPRLIIPFYDKNKKCFGFQGRAFGPSELKYITIMLDKSKPKIFGLDSFNRNESGFILEGPIDSMFLPNSLAMVGADFMQHEHLFDKNLITVIYDNEPRNREIIARISKCISFGYKVVIWPKSMHLKDINDMVMSGYTIDEIIKIINNNTFSGLMAQYILNDWKRT